MPKIGASEELIIQPGRIMDIRRLAGHLALCWIISFFCFSSAARAQDVPDPVPISEWKFLADEAVTVLAAQGFPESLTPSFARSAIRAYTFARLIAILDQSPENRTLQEQAAYDRLQSAVRASRLAIARNAVTYWESIDSGDPCWSGGNPNTGIYVQPNVLVSLFCSLFEEDKPNQREVYRGQGAAENYALLLSGNGATQLTDLLEAMDWYAALAEVDGGTLFQGDTEAEQSYQAALNLFRTIRTKERAAFLLSLLNPAASPEFIIRALLVLGTTVWNTADFVAIGNDLRAERTAAQSANPDLEDALDGPITELALVFMGTVLDPVAISSGPCGFNASYVCERWPLRQSDPDYTFERYDSLPIPEADTRSYFALKPQAQADWQVASDLSPYLITGDGMELWSLPVSGSSELNGELGGSSTRLQDPLPSGISDPNDLRVPAGTGLSSFVADGFIVHSPVVPGATDGDELWKFGTTIKYKNWAGEWWKALFVNDTFLHIRDGYEVAGFAQVAGFVQTDGGLIIQDGTYTDGYRYCKAWTRFATQEYSTRDPGKVDGQCILLSRDFDHSQLAVGDRISIGGRERTIKHKVNCEGIDLNNTGPAVDLFVGQLWCDDDSTNDNYDLPASTTNWGRVALIVDTPLQSLVPSGTFGQYGPSPWLKVRKLEALDTCAKVTTGIPDFSCGPSFNPQSYDSRNFDFCPRFGEPVNGDSSMANGYREFVFEDDLWESEFAPMACFYSPMVRYRDVDGNNWSGLYLAPAHAQDDAYTIVSPSRVVTYMSGVVMNDNIPSSDSITDKSAYEVSLVQDVAHGTLALNSDGSFLYTRGLASSDNPYCAPAGDPYCGPDSFEYEVCTSRDGRTDCDTALVELTVANEPPRAFDVSFELSAGDYVASYIYWDPEGDTESGTGFEWTVRNSWVDEFTISTATNVLPENTQIPNTGNPAIAEVVRVSVTPAASRGSWPHLADSYASDDNWELEYGIRIECDPEYLSAAGDSSACVFSPWINRPYTVDEPYWLELGTQNLAYKFSNETCMFDDIVGFDNIGDQTCSAALERDTDFGDNGSDVLATASIWLDGGFDVGDRVYTSAKNFGRLPVAISHTISRAAFPTAGGTLTCPDEVADGADALCTAQPEAGWEFVGWTGDCVGFNPICTVAAVDESKTVVAHFLPRISVSAAPLEGGSVHCTPDPVALGGSATCTTTPAEGFAFAAWGGDCTGLDPICTLSSVSAPLSVSANFFEVFPSGDGVTLTGGLPWVQVATTNGWSLTSRNDETNPTRGWIPLSESPDSPEIPPPDGVELIYGVLDIALTGGTVGSVAEVTITYPEPLPAGTQYWKYDRILQIWYPLDPSAYAVSGNTITLSLTDGGTGDHDGTANGTIIDPGGPASASAATPIPAVSPWLLAMLAALMGGLGWATRRSGR
ncbi:MAG: hypothetical protein H2060_02825 [Azoarcus sp.]|nr:hypothetical protein [Azoarcus sp.]